LRNPAHDQSGEMSERRFAMLGKDTGREPFFATNVTLTQAKKLALAVNLTGFIMIPEVVSTGDYGVHRG
jgi:hypothetical protein